MDQNQIQEALRYLVSSKPDDNDPANLAIWALQELELISTVLNGIGAGHCDFLNSPPEKPRNGDIRMADGVNWNPGGLGRGYYGFDEQTSSWRKLG